MICRIRARSGPDARPDVAISQNPDADLGRACASHTCSQATCAARRAVYTLLRNANATTYSMTRVLQSINLFRMCFDTALLLGMALKLPRGTSDGPRRQRRSGAGHAPTRQVWGKWRLTSKTTSFLIVCRSRNPLSADAGVGRRRSCYVYTSNRRVQSCVLHIAQGPVARRRQEGSRK